jgi:hypothetical protein
MGKEAKRQIRPKCDLEEHLAFATNTLLTIGRIKYDLWKE